MKYVCMPLDARGRARSLILSHVVSCQLVCSVAASERKTSWREISCTSTDLNNPHIYFISLSLPYSKSTSSRVTFSRQCVFPNFLRSLASLEILLSASRRQHYLSCLWLIHALLPTQTPFVTTPTSATWRPAQSLHVLLFPARYLEGGLRALRIRRLTSHQNVHCENFLFCLHLHTELEVSFTFSSRRSAVCFPSLWNLFLKVQLRCHNFNLGKSTVGAIDNHDYLLSPRCLIFWRTECTLRHASGLRMSKVTRGSIPNLPLSSLAGPLLLNQVTQRSVILFLHLSIPCVYFMQPKNGWQLAGE